MYEKELKIAVQAVKKAEKNFRKYFGTKTKVEMKDGNYRNLVSYADKKIELDVKSFLKGRFPDFGFIGEEHGHTNYDSEFVWAFDPIDGTTNYLQSLPDCVISLALLRKNKPVVGVIYAPFLNKLYTAYKGSPAKLNGKVIRTSGTADLKNAFGSLGWGRNIKFAAGLFPKLVRKVRKIRILGSAALAFCYVAQGAYDFLITKSIEIWDYAAGQVILEQAGGIYGKLPDSGLHIVSNKTLSAVLIKETKKLLK